MNRKRYRAWRFLHPDLDVSLHGGLQVAAGGGIAMVDEAASVRQAILLLLTTRPGERVMRPRYGCSLYRLVFSPNDDTTAGLAIHYVRQALDRWEPRIEILGLDAGRDASEPERLEIKLDYRVRATQQRDSVRFAMRLDEGVG